MKKLKNYESGSPSDKCIKCTQRKGKGKENYARMKGTIRKRGGGRQGAEFGTFQATLVHTKRTSCGTINQPQVLVVVSDYSISCISLLSTLVLKLVYVRFCSRGSILFSNIRKTSNSYLSLFHITDSPNWSHTDWFFHIPKYWSMEICVHKTDKGQTLKNKRKKGQIQINTETFGYYYIYSGQLVVLRGLSSWWRHIFRVPLDWSDKLEL